MILREATRSLGMWDLLPFNPLASLSSAALGSLMIPWVRDSGYSGNRVGTRAAPPIDAILAAYYRGRFGPPHTANARSQMLFALSEHGVAVGEGVTGHLTRRGIGWQAYIDASKPWPSFDNLRAGWLREWPGITRDMLEATLRRQGILDENWQRLAIDLWLSLGMGDLVQALNRGFVNDDYFSRSCRVLGFTRSTECEILRKLSDTVIGAGDAVNAALHHSHDPAVAEQLDLDSDLPNYLTTRIKDLGLNWSWNDGATTGATALWRSRRPSLSAMLGPAALGRLQGDWLTRMQLDVPDCPPFTQADMDAILKVEGWPAKQRKWVQAMAYAEPRITELKKAAAHGFLGYDQLFGAYKARGFSTYTATLSATVDQAEITGRNLEWVIEFDRRARQEVAKCAESAYETGIITPLQAAQTIANVQQPLLIQTLQTVQGLPDAVKVKAAVDTATAGLLSSIDMCKQTELAKEAIRAVQKAFLTGEITAAQAAADLTTAGVLAPREQQYLSLWRLQLTTEQKHLQTGQILTMVASGLLTEAQGLARLTNLGWVQPDALLLAAHAERAFQRALTIQQRAQNPEAPLAELKKFFKDGIISEDELRKAMQDRHWNQSYIDATIKSLTQPKPAPPAKPAPAPRPIKERVETIGMINKWFEKGVITEDQYKEFCGQVGWPSWICENNLAALMAKK